MGLQVPSIVRQQLEVSPNNLVPILSSKTLEEDDTWLRRLQLLISFVELQSQRSSISVQKGKLKSPGIHKIIDRTMTRTNLEGVQVEPACIGSKLCV